jgi:hypothetical protein
MKNTLYIFFALLLFSTSLFAQTRVERPLSSFNKIKAGSSFNVFIKKGNEEKVVIEARSGDIDKIITKVEGRVLTIGTETNWWRNMTFNDVKIYVTYRELEEVTASGSGSVRVESPLNGNNIRLSSSGSGNLYCDRDVNSTGSIIITNSGSGSSKLQASVSSQNAVEIVNSGSGSISIAELNSNQTKINNSGSGGIRVNSGSVRNQSVVMSGSGSLHMGQTSSVCNVRKSGSGSLHVAVMEELSGNSSGSGNIYLAGGRPHMDISVSGSGRIRHVNK